MRPDKDGTILVCAPASWPHQTIGIVFGYNCSRCGQGVMVALAGQKMLAEEPATIICCLPCVEEEIGSADDVQLAPGALEELAADLARKSMMGKN